MKFRVYLLTIVSLILVSTNDALAMSCSPKKFNETIKQADIVFMGKVIKRDSFNEKGVYGKKYSSDEPYCGSKVATFEIYKTWKGHIQGNNKTTVYSSDGCFGLGDYFKLNHLYIIFANTNTRELPIDSLYRIGTICDGTKDLFPEYPEDKQGKYIIELIQNLDNTPKNKD